MFLSVPACHHRLAYALNDLFGENKIDKFELAKVGQATEHNYCGVNCGIMDQFASVFGKKDNLIRLDCRSLEYQYFHFEPKGYRLVLVHQPTTRDARVANMSWPLSRRDIRT